MRNIKNLIKEIVISGIVVILNMVNVMPSFASDSFHVSKATVDNNGSTIVQYSNGSWYSYNNSTKKYLFKSAESSAESSFNSIDDMDKFKNDYINIKSDSNNLLLKNSIMNIGFGKHSEKIYVDNLQTNDNDDDSEIFKDECVKNGSNTNKSDIGFLKSHLQSTV